jgi:GH25 family lysozyme M1 (1,4-beta-N-acetylmuramidase)
MTVYGVDVASYQGQVAWSSVYSAGVRFGFSKVTESTNYVNPTWSHNRAGMLGLGDKFLGGAYHFLHGGNGAAQARYFLSKAGDVSNLAVALDVEASGADAATSREWVAEFKAKTGGHPVIGYFPRWYWEAHGRPDLSFFDSIWQSAYVNGSGSPSALYAKVATSAWATFGNEPISILQFSSSGSVPGIPGECDVNAYRGSLDELRALALGEEDMALSADDKKWLSDNLFKLVLQQDKVVVPSGVNPGTNPTWRPDNLMRETYTSVQKTLAAVGALAAQDPNVDAQAVAAAVLAQLTPEKIAAAIPADIAEQVVDEIQSRLAS